MMNPDLARCKPELATKNEHRKSWSRSPQSAGETCYPRSAPRGLDRGKDRGRDRCGHEPRGGTGQPPSSEPLRYGGAQVLGTRDLYHRGVFSLRHTLRSPLVPSQAREGAAQPRSDAGSPVLRQHAGVLGRRCRTCGSEVFHQIESGTLRVDPADASSPCGCTPQPQVLRPAVAPDLKSLQGRCRRRLVPVAGQLAAVQVPGAEQVVEQDHPPTIARAWRIPRSESTRPVSSHTPRDSPTQAARPCISTRRARTGVSP